MFKRVTCMWVETVRPCFSCTSFRFYAFHGTYLTRVVDTLRVAAAVTRRNDAHTMPPCVWISVAARCYGQKT